MLVAPSPVRAHHPATSREVAGSVLHYTAAMQALQCKSCGAAMRAASFDRRLGVVVCDHCGAIFDLTRRSDRATSAPELESAPRGPAPTRAPVALPDRFRVDSGPGGMLVVSWRWFQLPMLFLLFFAIAWDSFLLFWYAMAFTQADAPWIMVVFPIAHVAAGVAITYGAIAGLVNRTRVLCSADTLKVRHGPLPWFPRPTIAVADLEQLYVERKVNHSKQSTTVTWNLLAVTRSHKGLPVVKGLDTMQQALWLEQELEQKLDIRDRPVAGEYRGDGSEQV